MLGYTITVNEYLISEKIPDTFIMESHETLEEDDVGWADEGGFC